MTGTGHDEAHAGGTLRIGLTGPIGCGKSTVAGWLGDRGAVVIDADEIARDVLGPGEPELAAVVRAFGAGIRRVDGSLDRAALAELVFGDPAALARLEAIVHPAVRLRISERLRQADQAGTGVVVIEAIRLVEGGLATLCDEVWLVTCSPATQRSRLAARGMDPADAIRRIDAQRDLEARARPIAARVLETDGSADATAEAAISALRAAIAAREGPDARAPGGRTSGGVS
jgi:dephospho-CoA kinase